MGDAQGELDLCITSCFFILPMASFSSCARARGIWRGGCFTGVASPVGISWTARWVHPKSVSSFEKTSAKCLTMLKITCLPSGVFPLTALEYISWRCSGILEFVALMYLTGTTVPLDKCWGLFFILSFVLVVFWMSVSACVFCRFTTSIPVPILKPSLGFPCGPSSVSCRPSISTQLMTSVPLSSNSASITESSLMIPCFSNGFIILTFPVTHALTSMMLRAIIMENRSVKLWLGSISNSVGASISCGQDSM